MKIQKVHRISSTQKMKNNPHYQLAKAGDCVSAELLVNQIVQSPSYFQKLTGFVCPVQKPAGNQIPVALAKLMCSHSKLTLYDSVFLQHTAHGSSMVERLYYHPYFSGKVIPDNYIIVDDVYTTGNTLRYLKAFLESRGANVTSAWCIGSGPSLQFEPNRILVRLLLAKFPSISNYFDIDLLTVPQIEYLLRVSSINRLWQIHSDNQLALSFA